MCNWFTCVITKAGQVLFCEEQSHEEVILRAGLPDTVLEDREFVRLEITPPDMQVTVDEVKTLPDWFASGDLVQPVTLARRLRPAWEGYKAAQGQAWAAYATDGRRGWEVYATAEGQAWEAYQAACQIEGGYLPPAEGRA